MDDTELFRNPPRIETARVILRRFEMSDADDAFAYAKDPDVSKFLPWEPHKSIEHSRAFIGSVIDAYEAGKVCTWAIEYKPEKKVIGGFSYHNWHQAFQRADFGYAMGKNYWNQGIMTEILTRMLAFGFETMGLNRIEATADDLNIGSWRVMEKCGMRQEGLFRQHMFYKGHFRIRVYTQF